MEPILLSLAGLIGCPHVSLSPCPLVSLSITAASPQAAVPVWRRAAA